VRRHAARDPDALWWYVFGFPSQLAKSTARSYAQRRIRKAFTEALQIGGYDKDGKRLAASEPTRTGQGRDDKPRALRASINMQVQQAALVMPYSAILTECESVVNFVKRSCRWRDSQTIGVDTAPARRDSSERAIRELRGEPRAWKATGRRTGDSKLSFDKYERRKAPVFREHIEERNEPTANPVLSGKQAAPFREHAAKRQRFDRGNGPEANAEASSDPIVVAAYKNVKEAGLKTGLLHKELKAIVRQASKPRTIEDG